MDIERTTLTSITCLGEIDDYVYDLSIADQDPIFFANNCLVKNTDSCYFSAWPIIKDDVEAKRMEWDKETSIALYDSISDHVNTTFPDFMYSACHIPSERGKLIKGGREVVASKGLFIGKKLYALLLFDKDGKRKDINGKPGEVYAKGLSLKRSDTPKIVQDFLSEVLLMTLDGTDKEKIFSYIRDFKVKFKELHPWQQGTPKRVNALTSYTKKAQGKGMIPGHVRAAINWNAMREIFHDTKSMAIQDGQKVIVCYLRSNPLKMTSIAYPIDELRLPSWFKDLSFDDDKMFATIVETKLENLIGILKWDINDVTNINSTFGSLFS
jgi:DNA polymerase elongation subunit (family B)